MSRKLSTLLFAFIVLTGAMGLKTLVAAHSSILIANGCAPAPPPRK